MPKRVPRNVGAEILEGVRQLKAGDVGRAGVPSRSWEWDEGMSRSGVHTSEGKLVWWNRPAGDGGRFCEVATEQSFEAFVGSGAPVFVPDPVERELRALILSVG